jgi:hypothetical protein
LLLHLSASLVVSNNRAPDSAGIRAALPPAFSEFTYRHITLQDSIVNASLGAPMANGLLWASGGRSVVFDRV